MNNNKNVEQCWIQFNNNQRIQNLNNYYYILNIIGNTRYVSTTDKYLK